MIGARSPVMAWHSASNSANENKARISSGSAVQARADQNGDALPPGDQKRPEPCAQANT